jgi:hypothetical protein
VFELYLSHTSFGEHSTDPRNRFHETAMREARIVSEWDRGEPVPGPSKPSLVARMRLAFAGGPSHTTEACNCPA